MGSRILIVEDEQLVALDIQRRLTQLGHEVVAICDRAEMALEAANTLSPELVLMDIHLKGDVDGISVAAQIREHYKIPIIFLTAHADEATVTQAKATHPFGYLIKPVQTKHLSTAIEIAFSWHQAETIMQKALAKERDLSEALQRALIKEKQLNELKSQFVSIVSHEFRNPLASIMATLNILESQDARLTTEQRLGYVNQAKGVTTNLVQLFDDVLTLSETESSQFYCHPVPTDILWFCRELVHEYQAQPSNHAIHFMVEGCDETSSAFYDLDPKLLRHILSNLLSNAVKYSPESSTIQFRLCCAEKTLSFCIEDQGIGILPEDQIRLFEPFCRGANVRAISGTGLGLFIVKKCVDVHGGSITVNSTVGIGSTFTVVLPLNN